MCGGGEGGIEKVGEVIWPPLGRLEGGIREGGGVSYAIKRQEMEREGAFSLLDS